MLVQVNHAAPICDTFCRCTNCKPSPVGRTSESLLRVRVAALLMLVVAIGLAFIR